MKQVIPTIAAISLLIACNDTESTEKVQNIGGQKDEHGCITATGATWSELAKECIQLFNIAKRLNPVDVRKGDAVISAFVLFNDDQSKVELFLPDNDRKSIILNKSNGIKKFIAEEHTN
jgi:hypothetical protein